MSYKGAELGHLLLLNTNMKSHMGCPTAPSDLTLSDTVTLKGQSQGHTDFEALYLVKEELARVRPHATIKH